jgi:hypothetical protein
MDYIAQTSRRERSPGPWCLLRLFPGTNFHFSFYTRYLTDTIFGSLRAHDLTTMMILTSIVS